jgi:hypothetical protein
MLFEDSEPVGTVESLGLHVLEIKTTQVVGT